MTTQAEPESGQIARLWDAQHRDPAAVDALAAQLLEARPDDTSIRVRAEALCALAALRRGDVAAARVRQSHLAARAAAGDAVAVPLAADVAAALLRRSGNAREALALQQPLLELPVESRPPAEWCLTHTGLALSHEALADVYATLRHHHRAVAAAEASGYPALIVSTRLNLGSVYLDLHDLDAALEILVAARRSALDAGFPLIAILAGINLLITYDTLGRHDDALALCVGLEAEESRIPAERLPGFLVHFARARLRTGDVDAASGRLARSAAMRPVAAGDIEWTTVAAQVELARSRPAEALRLCTDLLRPAHDRGELFIPFDRRQLHATAAAAAEAMGDLETAVAHRAEAYRQQQRLLGNAAQSRRVALDSEYAHRRSVAAQEARRVAALEAAAQRDAESRQAEALRRIDATRTRFLAAASHDLRQPVHALGLMVEELAQRPKSAEQSRLAEPMASTLASLSALLDDLPGLAGATSREERPQSFAVIELLSRIDAEFAPIAARRGLQLRLRADDEVVLCDESKLGRILGNLVDNALNHTRIGGVLVAVRQRGGATAFEVWDTGSGIAAEHLTRVWDPYYQVTRGDIPGLLAQDRSGTGIGYGLAIVRRLADAIGATLEVRSREGRGSCFRVVLAQKSAEPRSSPGERVAPSSRFPQEDDRVADARDARPSAPLLVPAGLRVLLLEDHPEISRSLSALLSARGCAVVSFATAEAALADPLRFRDIDLAVVDLRLPGANGLEALAGLRAGRTRPLPALVLTGDLQWTPPALPPATAWLAKPARWSDIAHSIAGLLAGTSGKSIGARKAGARTASTAFVTTSGSRMDASDDGVSLAPGHAVEAGVTNDALLEADRDRNVDEGRATIVDAGTAPIVIVDSPGGFPLASELLDAYRTVRAQGPNVPDVARAAALARLADLQHACQDLEHALSSARAAVECARRGGDSRLVEIALATMIRSQAAFGDAVGASDVALEAQVSQTTGLSTDFPSESEGIAVLSAYGDFPGICAEAHALAGRRSAAEAALALAHPMRAEPWRSPMRALAIAELTRTEDPAKALALLQRAAAFARTPVDRLRLGDAGAHAARDAADWRSALGLLREAEDALAAVSQANGESLRLAHRVGEAYASAEAARVAASREQERARRERERAATLNASLAAVNETRLHFLAAASHDLRQPVASLALFVEALAEQSRGDAGLSALTARMRLALDDLSAMLARLLHVVRLDAGVLRPRMSALELDTFVQAIGARHAAQATAAGLRWACRTQPATVETDPEWLASMVAALVDNAIAHTTRGGLLLGLRRGAHEVFVDVIDTGAGIADAHRPQVFDEFFQGGNAGRTRGGAAGLGLALVQRQAALLGIRIELASRAGKGTRVRLAMRMKGADGLR